MHFRFSRFITRLLIFLSQKIWWFIGGFVFLGLCFIGIRSYQFFHRLNIESVDILAFLGRGREKVDQTNDLTNFLLLGTRGEGSDSPNLADSILVFSLNRLSNQITLTSVPRDLWVPSLQAKINTAYHYGEIASPGAGTVFAQTSILETIGLPIHYTAVINFSLFKQVVDLVGGVDIFLDRGFTDTQFPIPGKENVYPVANRYETISFPAGNIHLDGETALKFVRSRHSEGSEGTDFARSQRQQLLIGSLRQKIFSSNFLLDQNKVNQLIEIITKNVNTNVPRKLYPYFIRLALNSYRQPLRSIPLSLDPDTDGVTILYHPLPAKYKGEWVIMPKDNNWSALKKYIANHLTSTI